MDELEKFINYINEIQIPLKKQIDEYNERVREREGAGMNTYGLETPGLQIAFLKNSAVNNLKRLVHNYSCLEDLEEAARNFQAEDEKNEQITWAIRIIEDFKSLDLNSNKGISMK